MPFKPKVEVITITSHIYLHSSDRKCKEKNVTLLLCLTQSLSRLIDNFIISHELSQNKAPALFRFESKCFCTLSLSYFRYWIQLKIIT